MLLLGRPVVTRGSLYAGFADGVKLEGGLQTAERGSRIEKQSPSVERERGERRTAREARESGEEAGKGRSRRGRHGVRSIGGRKGQRGHAGGGKGWKVTWALSFMKRKVSSDVSFLDTAVISLLTLCMALVNVGSCRPDILV